jgi:pimeloyl-ACP methyl ester carboxylesterase
MNPLPREELFVFVDDATLVGKEIWLQYLHPSNKIQDLNRLKNLAIPTLVIIGEKDKAIPVEFQKNIADIIPKAVKIVMSNEGHAVVIENPEKVLSEINSFLKNTCIE